MQMKTRCFLLRRVRYNWFTECSRFSSVYEVLTVTGDVKGAGTDANVFITLYGEFGVTPKVHLASKSRTAFEKNKTDVFRIKTHNVGPIKKIRIEHDNTGMSASWFLDRVIVTDMNRPHLRFFYACNNWLSRDEGDGLTVRYLLGSLNPMDIPKQNKYIASVFTMDAKGSGTDADVYLNIFGEFGDTGERKLASDGKDNFERGNEDKFTIEAPNLGRLRKITIGHNNKGSSAGWACDKVVVDDMGNKEVYEFPVNAWFDISEGDGKIQRDVLAGATQPMAIVYNVQVMTGDIRGAGTNSKIHFVMHGHKGIKNSGKVFLEGGTFERAQIDIFNVELLELLSPLSRVTIGHDNAGISCGWYCEKVLYCPFTGLEQVFPCGRWLDEDEGDGLVERELYEMVSLRQKKQKKFPWSLWIWTSEIKGAGTDAQVFVQVYGETGKSDEMRLESKSDSFEQGQCDKFIIEMPDFGKIRKLRIWHEKRNPFSGWHLGRVTLMKTLTREKYSFVCNRWLDINEDDNEIIRELPATGKLVNITVIKYRATICTGNVSGSGTDASVYLNIIGDLGDTGERLMFMSKNNANKFEKGNHDEFLVEAVTLGQIKRVRIGHDGRGGGCGWFLDKVMIREEGQPEASSIEFPCYRWLDRNEDDGQIVRELVPTDDEILSNDVDAHIMKYDINRMLIGHTNEGLRAGWFLDSVQIWVPVHGVQYMFPSHRWLCKDEADGKVEVEIYPSETLEIEKLINYEVTVVTGDVWAAGTNANVFLQIYGEAGKTELIQLKSRSNNFERGTTEIFRIEGLDVGRVYKIRIGHDGSGIGAGWFLEKVDVKRLKTLVYFFPCQRWLAVDEDDGQLGRELVPVDEAFMKRDEDEEEESSPAQLGLEQKAMSTTFTMRVKTGEKKKAGTDANVYAILYGTKDDTGIINLKASKNHRNKYELGLIDEFTIEAVDIGKLKRIRIGHDNAGASPGWFLDWVEIDAPSLGQLLRFPCGRWLDKGKDDGAIVRDLYPNELQTVLYTPFVPYEIKIFTSDIFAAGTDADVFIVLYGQNGVCTSQKSLCVNKRERRMYFERGAEDMFIVELEDIGDIIEKIRIGHDNRGVNPGWHLDRVEIRRLLRKGKGSETTIFPCEVWLARSEEDGETIRELVPSDIIVEKLSRDGTLKVIETEVDDALEIHTYTVTVTTGDVYGAGTDANVFITLYGDMGDAGERKLNKSENSNKFERGSVDTFTLEAVDLGQVFKIRVRHDNSMLSADWYLEQVEVVDQDTEEVFLFLCERWLSRKKEDKRIDRVFYVKVCLHACICAPVHACVNNVTGGKLNVVCVYIVIPYHFSVTTGSDRDAGTSSRVYVIIIGKKNKKTDRLWLDLDGKNGFLPGSLDYFTCYGTDVGDIKKVELGHDGATPESCWFVEELTVDVPTKAVRYVFPCICWLAKDRGDGLTARFFDVQDAETVNIPQKVIYEVTVITGDVQHAGTDTQIFMTVFGVYGTSEEMLLPKLEDRFERGQKDTFNLEIEDIAPLRKMRVRIDGSGSRPDWFLDKIELHNLQTDEVALFMYEEWLSHSYGPKRMLLCEMPAVINDEEMVELTTYTISVKTSDVTAAGTDANVWMVIFGENGDTGTLTLKESNNTNKFERKQTDTFRFPDILSLGELSKVRIWHDNSGLAAGWHLEYVDVHDDILGKKFRFQCDRWLAKNEDDGQIMRELACANNDAVDFDEKTKYEILVTTADMDDAETKENAWIVLEGKKGRSKEFVMENSTKKKRFLRGATDRFEFSSKELGDIASICLGHIPKDGKKVKVEASWFVEEVVVTEKELGNKYIFRCGTTIPLSSKRDEFQTFECSKFIESFTSKAQSLVPVKYELIVITGDEKGAGTDANVFITIFGSNGDSGQRQLTKKFQNLFERGQTNRFILELLDLGDLLRMHVEHDNSGLSPGWLLSRIEITNTANAVTTVFICGKWLDKNKADGRIKRVIYPKY
uniref:Lipoxygenase homology domains 1a n=1 Tax=Cyprinus carpio TaxID=7962 RepID=A0A8C1KV82_CYPCA